MARTAEELENAEKKIPFCVRLSDEQRELLGQKARKHGVSVARYMRVAGVEKALQDK